MATGRQATVGGGLYESCAWARPGKTDVPLNVRIGWYSSAPVDSASAVAGWACGRAVPRLEETRLTQDGLR